METEPNERQTHCYAPEALSDVTLYCDDGELRAHSHVLGRSPVFLDMMTLDMKEKHTREVHLHGKSYDELRELLDMLYGQAGPPNADNAERIVALADEYGLDYLKIQCEGTLESGNGMARDSRGIR